jgi:hypothetical protein
MPMSRFVRVRTRFEGLHRWPHAPEPEDYLRSPHRHLFVVEADIEVVHGDREIEINAAARWLDTVIPRFARPQPVESGGRAPGPPDFGTLSCEDLAAAITEEILERYGRYRTVRCAVLEDGIMGAGVTWQPGTPA